jgi:hypothetical protein
MKIGKREKLMKQIAIAALIMGVYSPLAEASISPKDGVSAAELAQIVDGLEVQQRGNGVVIAGIMPRRCADGATIAYDYRDGKHLATIRMPKCENDFKREAEDRLAENQVDAADIFNEIRLRDQSGRLHLRHYKRGSRLATDRVQDEEMRAQNGEPIEVVSRADREAEHRAAREREAQDLADRQARESEAGRNRALDELHSKVLRYCQQGDYVGLGQEILGASSLLGDVVGLMERVNAGMKDKLKRDLARASTAEDARTAYEAFLEAAIAQGWDEDELKKPYIEKRFEILAALAEDGSAGETRLSEVARNIRDWMTELRGIDSREYRKQRGKFAELYGDLATHAVNANNLSEAERYFDRAKALSDLDGQIKIDGAMSKVYAERFKECVKKNPTKMDMCERRYLSKAKSRADSIKSALARRSGEGASADLEAFQAEYIQTFGAGASFTWTGYGSMQQLPGAVDRFKMQTYQQYMQQQQMMMMQRMYGIGTPGATAQRSGILGF